MREKAHENYMAGPSYDLSPFARLYVMATSAFFGENGYYEDVHRKPMDSDWDTYGKFISYLTTQFGTFGDEMTNLMSGKNRAEAMKEAIQASLAYDTELTLRFLAWLRNKALIRATPAVGLAIASKNDMIRGSGLLKTVSNDILSRLDDTTNCLAYYLKEFGKPIPNGLKKVLANRLNKATEYELAKYAGKNKNVTLRDVIRLVHAHSNAIDKFCKDEISQATEGQETWEAIISKEGSTKEAWTKAVGVMGHMALLRNLRNLEKHEVDTDLYLDKLVAGVENGKQLPFRYYSAWKNVTSAKIRKALEKCIDMSVKNLPKLKGRSLILVDNSGSATGTHVSSFSNVNVSTCGNLMGFLTALLSDDGVVGVFGDKIKYVPINKNSSGSVLQLLDVVNNVGKHIGSGTENGIWLALDEAIRREDEFDRIFIYSDMQAGHGGLYGLDNSKYPVFKKGRDYWSRYIDVPKLVAEYRQKVNPKCKLYSIQIGGYSDNIFPEFYPNTCIMGGWSTELLRFVTMYEKDPNTIEDMFRKEFGLKKKK